MRRLQEGEGTRDGQITLDYMKQLRENNSHTNSPNSRDNVTLAFEEELAEDGDDNDLVYAMVAGTSEAEGLDPSTVQEAKSRSDWPKWHDAIAAELKSLTFLNGKLGDGEDIYMELLEGYLAPRNLSRPVAKLNVALYGSKQGALKWYQELSATLGDLGLQCMHADWGVFHGRIGKDIIILASHVDDCTVMGSSPNLIRSFKAEINTQYKITDLGPIGWLLGMKESYINAILTKYNLADAKPSAIPMDPSLKLMQANVLQPAKEATCMKNVPYHAAVGSLMHLAVGTRPDIAFTVSTVAQFNNAPTPTHWEAIKWIYKYLVSTKSLALTFGGIEKGLKGYTDADGAMQEHCHTISGYTYLLDGGVISWASCKQELITLSTAEVEYVVATHAAKEGLWLRWLISEMFCPLKYPIPLYSDNQAAIALTKDGSYHSRTKHIDIRYHFIRFATENGSFHLIYCPTEEMVADTLTKALPSIKAKHFVQSLGLCSK
ncbi:hypothetical protein PISMIDRAFT_16670 [Pisolithus microcarpus 441]|uniref:Reverse transcriptase Ty1/copia-type domain-containing protein n=1 Tax=Pisolithus microcarpus 441 TaxID=765257 RepID=A0A0C9YYG1_9AGAM|nr:hypothetical protein PISMIDRAFT_16670 [Pisolithus microcarpus 441]